MVKIRLARAGAKKRPFYHLVATDSRSPRDSMFIERLGFYNPVATGGEQKLVFDQARIDHWTSKGAQVSDRVTYLLKHVPSSPQGGRIEGHVATASTGSGQAKAEGSAAKAA